MRRSELLQKFASHDVAVTPQRLEVAAVLLQRPQHLSADQILDRLRRKGSRLSRATVYNSLNLFAKNGLVREIHVDPERVYYDSSVHRHHHFYNLDSGELTDIDEGELDLANMPSLPDGTRAESVDIVINLRNR